MNHLAEALFLCILHLFVKEDYRQFFKVKQDLIPGKSR